MWKHVKRSLGHLCLTEYFDFVVEMTPAIYILLQTSLTLCLILSR